MTAHVYLALAARLGALSPSTAVQAHPERMAQWSARLLLAGSIADRREADPERVAAAVSEVDLYSGRPIAARLGPAPMPPCTAEAAL